MGKGRTRGCRQFWENGVFRYCFKHRFDSVSCARYNASTCQRFSRRTYYKLKLEGSDHSADKFDIQLSKPDDVTTTSTLGSASECAFKTSLQACSASELDTDQEKLSNPADVTTTSTLGSDQVQSCDSSTTSANL
ncbi:unnamed protein product [Arabidopsis halleri]